VIGMTFGSEPQVNFAANAALIRGARPKIALFVRLSQWLTKTDGWVSQWLRRTKNHFETGLMGGVSNKHQVNDVIDVGALRRRMGVSRRHFAGLFGLSLGTLCHWELGNRRPARRSV
jgi:DNA-binding transcriptional regulator YiaG